MKTFIHIDYSVADDCINLMESYGAICVKCNACGRFDKSTQKECALRLYNRYLDEQLNFDRWHDDEDLRKLQEKNIAENIKYFKKKIRELEV